MTPLERGGVIIFGKAPASCKRSFEDIPKRI